MSVVIKISKVEWSSILAKKGVVFIELFVELLKENLAKGRQLTQSFSW